MTKKNFIFTLILVLSQSVNAQPLYSPQAGPVIEPWGAVFDMEDLDFKTPTDQKYRVVFDVSSAPAENGALNAQLNTVARFLNMHARAGVPIDNMEVAVVLHGGAGKYVLNRESFRNRYNATHTNLDLMEALNDAGVQFYMCGQTAVNRGFAPEDRNQVVKMALSAMTALLALQKDGFQLIAF